MKRRMQITFGPRSLKAVEALSREHEVETGMRLRPLVIVETATRIGLALMLKGKVPKLTPIASLRD